jgi:aspartate carbamoyltransferase catalytic subunit
MQANLKLKSPHILGIDYLVSSDIDLILRASFACKKILTRPVDKLSTLRGRTVVNLFFESSTRTRSSFEIAEKRLNADILNFASSSSSVTKGETLLDTARNLQSMAPDIIVIRHSASGSPQLLARVCQASIVNAGDGMHEHPTQAFLDAVTIIEKRQRIKGLKIAIVGDIRHSRVARSDTLLFSHLGAEVWVCGPPTLLPEGFSALGCRTTFRMEEAIADADVVIALRVQQERQKEAFFPSIKEYFELYGLTTTRLQHAHADALVMHPGPMNRGVEIASDVADGPASVILDQVTNGVAVRMAILHLLGGGTLEELEEKAA